MKKTPNNSTPLPCSGGQPLEEQVFRALLTEGYIIPETPDELRLVEAHEAPHAVPLPAKLDDADTVLRRVQERIADRQGKTVPFPLPQEAGVEEDLKRAARHGGHLPEEIKAKMEANRRNADRKADADRDAE